MKANKNPKTEKCSDCGGTHDVAFGLLMNMVKGIRLAPDEAIAALCASITESNVAHWSAMTRPQRIAHNKENGCVLCEPNQILGAITDDFAPVPRRKALTNALAAKAKTDEAAEAATTTVN
jgi:hypothetical protein